jgi:predicted RNA-binding protein YlxR (DUF448 family)
MIRVVRLGDGELAVDRNGPGRGAWLCRNWRACLDEAERRHAFERALGPAARPGSTERLRFHLNRMCEDGGLG